MKFFDLEIGDFLMSKNQVNYDPKTNPMGDPARCQKEKEKEKEKENRNI